METNRGSGRGGVRVGYSFFSARWGGGGRVHPYRQDSLGGVRSISADHIARGLARCASVYLRGFEVFAAFTQRWVGNLGVALRPGRLGRVARTSCAEVWFANP